MGGIGHAYYILLFQINNNKAQFIWGSTAWNGYRILASLRSAIIEKNKPSISMKNIPKRIVLVAAFAITMLALTVYGCENIHSLFLSFRQERGEKISIDNASLSMRVSGVYRRYFPSDQNNADFSINFDNIDIHGKKIVLDISQIKVDCEKAFTLQWKAFTHLGNNPSITRIEIGGTGADEFSLTLHLTYDPMEFRFVNKKIPICSITLPMIDEPIHIMFKDSDRW